MDFSYNIRFHQNIVIIDFIGCTLDIMHASPLLSEVDAKIEEGKIFFIVNLAQVDYMNSSGLNVLINILTKCRNHSGEMIIYHVSEKVKTLLITSKLTTIFDIERSEQSALEKIKMAQKKV